MKRYLSALFAASLSCAFLSSISSQAASSAPSPVCTAGTCTVDFPFTGDFYSWSAPITGTYTLEVWGAQGGDAGYNGTVMLAGGKGGYAKGNLNLTATNAISIYVGGKGEGAASTTLSARVAGGWNGGGQGFNGELTSDERGAGGGGASDVRVGGSSLSNRVIVAGGGGGGVRRTAYGTNYPGVGGGTSGGDGGTATYDSTYVYNGKGGTQSAGGARGANCGAGVLSTAGTIGVGGQSDGYVSYGAGGGGGGYYGGGGGGCGMGAGGGSGYVGGVTSTTLSAGNASMPNPAGGTMTGRTGNGFVRITYAYTPGTISLTIAGNVSSSSKGVGITLTAAINVSGNVTFYANNKRIAGCINMPASSGNKTCTWKPTRVSNNEIYAKLSQGGSVVATSASLNIAGIKRTGRR